LNAVIDVFLKRQAELSANAEAPVFVRDQVKRYRREYDRASLELSGDVGEAGLGLTLTRISANLSKRLDAHRGIR
jgi:hypothetical protein